jgi:hypothetical protein
MSVFYLVARKMCVEEHVSSVLKPEPSVAHIIFTDKTGQNLDTR